MLANGKVFFAGVGEEKFPGKVEIYKFPYYENDTIDKLNEV